MRIGSINYINSLPVDMALWSNLVSHDYLIHRDFPSGLNQLVADNLLDISPVSAYRYAELSEDLTLLPNLSISSQNCVQSVLLVSRYPIQELGEKTVFVTNQGQTTPVLLKILLKERYGLSSHYIVSDRSFSDTKNDDKVDATLVIGDDALKVIDDNQPNIFVYDLAKEWKDWTGLPFVFALWVVRKKYLQNNPKSVEMFCSKIQESCDWGRSHYNKVLDEAIRVTGISKELLDSYFSNLQYGWNDELEQGLKLYFEKAFNLNFLKKVPDVRMVQHSFLEG